jgi:hypothetical protein
MLIFAAKNKIMNQNKTNVLIGIGLIVFAAVLKVTTYPHTFDPIIAISLFSGAIISDRKLAFVLPLLAMFISDVIFEVFNIAQGFYGWEQLGNYAALLFITVLGFFMKKINPITVVGYSVASSILFYFLSNTNTFLFDTFNTYDNTMAGYIKCMAAGIPFMKIPENLVYSIVLFGSYTLLMKSSLKKEVVKA